MRQHNAWVWILPAAALAATACTGSLGGRDGNGIDGPGSNLPRSTPTDFVCNPELVPEQLPGRRLSRAQYHNTIRALTSFAAPERGPAVLDQLAPLLDGMVSDLLIGEDSHYARLSRRDQSLQQNHADTLYAVGNELGRLLTENDEILAEVVGACATDADPANDDACLDELIRRFGERALRRAVRDDDVTFYRDVAGAPPFEREDYADVIAMLVNAPDVLLFLEQYVEGEEGEHVRVGPYALASRLSYHFWQSPPDEELLRVARDGSILTDEVYEAQLERVFADPRTRDSLREFFSEWLANTTLEDLSARIGEPVYDSMRGELAPSGELQQAMWEEVVDAAVYYTLDAPGTFADFFRSDLSFARNEELAELYGVPAWDGTSSPPPLTDRAGQISRAAIVATGHYATRPIMKGVLLRKAILCDTIPPVPDDVPPAEVEGSLSTRDFTEGLTGVGSCAGCHNTLINGLGYPTENFDPLGRVRTEEPVLDYDTGAIVTTVAVDTAAVPFVELDDDRPVQNADELTERILESEKPYACFARRYVQYTLGRVEDLDRDGCMLESIQEAARSDAQTLADALTNVARSDAFERRSFVQE
ncbi:MAG: DUF1592 domain-containing protein [Myxococcota bacterium]